MENEGPNSPRSWQTLSGWEKRIVVTALIAGLIIGYGLRSFSDTDRFALREFPQGAQGMYKIDKRTGRTWIIVMNQEIPVTPPK